MILDACDVKNQIENEDVHIFSNILQHLMTVLDTVWNAAVIACGQWSIR